MAMDCGPSRPSGGRLNRPDPVRAEDTPPLNPALTRFAVAPKGPMGTAARPRPIMRARLAHRYLLWSSVLLSFGTRRSHRADAAKTHAEEKRHETSGDHEPDNQVLHLRLQMVRVRSDAGSVSS